MARRAIEGRILSVERPYRNSPCGVKHDRTANGAEIDAISKKQPPRKLVIRTMDGASISIDPFIGAYLTYIRQSPLVHTA